MKPTATQIVRTMYDVQLIMSQDDASHLYTILAELTRPNIDGFGFLLRSFETYTVRDIKATADALKGALASVTITRLPKEKP